MRNLYLRAVTAAAVIIAVLAAIDAVVGAQAPIAIIAPVPVIIVRIIGAAGGRAIIVVAPALAPILAAGLADLPKQHQILRSVIL